MRPGKLVTYHGRGAAREGVVAAVVDTGGSGYKVLDLTVDAKAYEAVPHEADRVGSKGYWTERGSEHAAPADEVHEVVPAPVVPEQSAGRATAGVGDNSGAGDE